MEYKVCICTDKGTVKEVNQDSAMVKVANTSEHGRVAVGVLCDGMGGLSCGEVASSKAVEAFENWFVSGLPQALSPVNVTEKLDDSDSRGVDIMEEVKRQWLLLAQDINEELLDYGSMNGLTLGSTVVSFLVMENEFLIMNIGDSRAYQFTETRCDQLTHDQSVVQNMLDRGLITPQEAENSPQKSVLLQCLGASGNVYPQIVTGRIDEPTTILLCCDGLWRKLRANEAFGQLRPSACTDEATMKSRLLGFIDTVKSRGETDNITGVLICCQ